PSNTPMAIADELIICHQKQPIGIAKKVCSRIKNNYPRELLRDGKLFSVEDPDGQRATQVNMAARFPSGPGCRLVVADLVSLNIN
ncbi:hypothetical protein LXA26_18360, partial [Erwinia amylovora]|uniref:methyltransferase RsmF C-terminal domain-like protein n=1 Tax=Erwinia amylovora TaxID=552 RepID=UPI003F745522|nr:hypothetical protein [Erwinia amylovora]